ncbi:Rrf2 family transcriptional regulator [Halomonas sp. QX-2]|jgi:Rrf2 family nitric oxide-sensitive transcriptional repressor|uniref:Rrf2 family transcriptional regulator n=1 Tax=Vreelandella sedimenti TaxID=2729618 RepID=A0A7Z0SN91_9GAMM|nr:MULTISPECIES: Rrf2 family transcriptional regulator [Halomonadaceae]MEA2118550.1 Rrf2 family transcriptional regulator [Halovibrio sp. HP20-59]NYT72741.1 Rrf2 family transcriptional regulator [Halomonas sedimenti]|tara:strand:+ start:6536 stop:6982 length:447 start_codon:yes stop_codon:yes gene_type:complete
MHLTRFTDYSIRVLIFLAVKGEERSTINEIAETFDISRNHLMKVVQELSQKNYVTAIRGKNGGLLLTRDPATIVLGQLVREMEHGMELVECFHSDNSCIITPSCRLRPILNEALTAFLAVLDRYTLADVLTNRYPQLAGLMRIPTVNT